MKKLQHSVHIKATKEKVWDILIDVPNWKLWDKDVKSAKLHGPFAVGTKGTLVAIDDNQSTFVITQIEKYSSYSNYYLLPLFTKLQFTHQIETLSNQCKMTFLAHFTGPFAWYFEKKQSNALKAVMEKAMNNLMVMCQ